MGLPRNVSLLLALLLITGLSVMQAGEARKNGVSGRAVGGCTCHGDAQPWTGVAGQLPMVLSLEGVPDEYEPGVLYPLELAVSGGLPYLKAGFNLNATFGTLSVPSGEENVQITTKDTFGAVAGEATHKTPDSRAWKVDWTAPREGAGVVAFFLAINSVNGNDQPDALDQWNLAGAVSAEKNFAPRPPVVIAIKDAAVGSVAVNWTASPDLDIVRHELYAIAKGSSLADSEPEFIVENVTSQDLNVSGLEAGKDYEFVLRAVDKGGLSTDSIPVAARLADEPILANTTARQPASQGKESPAPAAGIVLGPLLLLAALGRRRTA